MKQILAILLLAFIFVGYQNCGKEMEFSPITSKVSDSGIIGTIDDDPLVLDNDLSEDDLEEIENGNDNNNNDVVDENEGDDSSEDPVEEDNGNDVVENDEGSSNKDKSCNKKEKHGYTCILEGSGKSQRLAYVDSQLVSQNSTPQTVCTTKRACLEIASQKFLVKSAEYRGYCKNNVAGTIAISESELQVLIDKIE